MGAAAEWALPEINSALKKGFVSQDIQIDFSAAITRQEFCGMAVMFLEYALKKDFKTILTDMGLFDEYFTYYDNQPPFFDTGDEYVLAAYTLGILDGFTAPAEPGAGVFTPDGSVSRQEAATMLMRICRILGMDTADPPVPDIADLDAADSWARDGINFVCANGIMDGKNAAEPMFDPKGLFTIQDSIVAFDRIR